MYDVLIIGAGPAGLSAATALARLAFRVVVFDSGSYRNELSERVHAVPGWDNRSPKEFREAAREPILAYYDTIRLEDAKIERVERAPSGGFFVAIDSHDRKWEGKKLVLACGVQDILPDIEGYAECWVKGIFHCLACSGLERLGCDSAGVLAVGDLAAEKLAIHVAKSASRLTRSVTIYTHGNGELTEALSKLLAGSEIQVEGRRITRFVKLPTESQVGVSLEGGTEKIEHFLVHKPTTEVKGPLAAQLGMELTSDGDVKAGEPTYVTSVPGAFAAGDCAGPAKSVVMAMASGAIAAGGAAMELLHE
ncbi:hypothetical protein RB594_004757 [Gaeumannomyces avenae]